MTPSKLNLTPMAEKIVRQAQAMLVQAARIRAIAIRGQDPRHWPGPCTWA